MPQPLMDASLPAEPRAAELHVRHSADPASGALAAAGSRSREPVSIGERERTAIRAAIVQARTHADHNTGITHAQWAHVRLPMGYCAAISFEWHPGGLYRHLWVYIDTPGCLPNMPSIRLIAQEFGFELDSPSERHTWLEELAPGHHAANVLEMQIPMARPAA